MGFALALILVFALALIGAPIALGAMHQPLGGASSTLMITSGIALTIVCVVLITITKLYVKTRASEAFVRTGMGGLKVIRDGGAIVLPVIHQVVRVSLETIRLDVERKGAEALITSDKLRADIKAEFFVRVQPQDESIQAAARSLGDKMTDDLVSRKGEGYRGSVSQLIEDKLVSALRTSAARKSLEQLNSERDEFLKEVTALVTTDLAHNGFTLETVTISKLDQTDEQHLKANNIFDAQGMRTIAEITQKNLTERNEIVRNGEQARTAQDVSARQKVLELERTRAEAEANQASQIAVITSEQERLTAEKRILTERAIQIAGVEQNQAVEVAKRQQAQAIEIAEKSKLQAVTEADQKLEVSRRVQAQAVAEADALKATAEARLATAEAGRQKARQEIVTVETLATADREKQKGVIAATAEAEKAYVTTAKAADGAAYKTKAEAEARKASADAEAEALRKQAEASADAQKAQAEGNKAVALAQAEGARALAMVPVEVRSKEVDLERRRVEEVLKPELQARETSGRVAQDFELAKYRIEKEAEVRIETAKASIAVYGKISANVYGTPEDVAKMGKAFQEGMGISQAISGFLQGSDEVTQSVTKKAVQLAEQVGSAVTERLKGETNGT